MKKDKDIETVLRETIKESSMNSREIARLAGLNEGALSLFINGKRGLTARSAGKLAKALGLHLVKKKGGGK